MVDSEELIGTAEHLTLYTRCRITLVVITGFDCIVIILRKPAFDINYLASEWLRYLFVPNARFECVSFCCVLGIPEFKSWSGYRLHQFFFFHIFLQSFQADVRVKKAHSCTGRTAHRGSKGIALLFLDHGTRRG